MGCPYCAKVVGYFNTNKIQFKWIDTNTEEGD
jgi:glutaredoxin 3